MLLALSASVLVALTALCGVIFFGQDKRLVGSERYVVPLAVGVFLSFILIELIPETLAANEIWGAIVIAIGFIGFYVFSNVLHKKFHKIDPENCDRKSAAMLLLFGDGVHNIADGVVLGGAFLINPAAGVATAIGLAIHEIPQEIVEFGVLLRAGYTKLQAALYNLLSASGIIVGTAIVLLISEHGSEFVWILTGLAAGNLLYLAASDLLPRIHGNLENYGSIWYSTASIAIGFILMTTLLIWTHEQYGHGHNDDNSSTISEEEHDH